MRELRHIEKDLYNQFYLKDKISIVFKLLMSFKEIKHMEIYGYIWPVNTYINKGIYEVQYNLIGLPFKTHFFNGNIIYTDYAADGRKLQTRYVYDSNEVAVIESDGGDDIPGSGDLDELFGSMAAVGGSVAQPDGGLIPGGDLINPEPLPLVQLLGKRDYCGGHIYLNDTIERVLTPVGYYNDLGDHFAYVKDWQGNVRVTIDQNGNVVEAVDYYPYGMVMEKDNEIATDAQPYKYGGKELDRRFGYDSYDFEARVYDPAVGRFTTPDPLAWDTPWISPYIYCAANPIRYIDPTGKRHGILKTYENGILRQITIVANYYVPKGEEEYAQSSANKWNETNATFNGIDISFQLSIHSVDVPSTISLDDKQSILLEISAKDKIGNVMLNSIQTEGEEQKNGQTTHIPPSGHLIELFSPNKNTGAHEVGHSLGLPHNKTNRDSLMYPYEQTIENGDGLPDVVILRGSEITFDEIIKLLSNDSN